ncbi:Transposase InsO and inactivated derivatives [Dyadobacter koreensis]|uniref:Transposase InsO and inactivated derivatives n=1 Tax=Dyadobacter koreensis TaxID=408657 RepID=A0A1H6T1L5_9BACT|nr:IS3 family transposase [Dyadobacter koreensis]SEI70135.1 Transposase InsO and inactivated derivatives [Dyadobacter koreensis]
MRQKHPEESLGSLCELFGVTRQAYYDAAEHEKKTSIAHMLILSLVREYRSNIPFIGTRKLLFLLIPDLKQHGIKIGRDQLFELLRFHGLLIRRRKRMVKTTDSHHWLKKYPNLIKGLEVIGPNQLWVSDLTYIRTLEGFSYLSLITDAFSRKIVGYSLYQTLEAVGCINALKMAVEGRKYDSPYFLIHHSDRGIQYCSAEYVSILGDENIAISMTQNGSPYDNALAERVNGIIKNEFYPKRVYQNHKEASKAISRIIQIYNGKRPHASVDYLTPEQAHEREGQLSKRWKTYRKKKKDVPESYEA